MEVDQIEPAAYAGLFASSFLAATLLPASSEALLAALIATGTGSIGLLLAIATIGNTLGSTFNWWLGRGIERYRRRRWFPVGDRQYAAAERYFNRFGRWSLLFAWLPVVGDPLTFVAGALRTPLWRFILLVATGKLLRYLVVAQSTIWWFAG